MPFMRTRSRSPRLRRHNRVHRKALGCTDSVRIKRQRVPLAFGWASYLLPFFRFTEYLNTLQIRRSGRRCNALFCRGGCSSLPKQQSQSPAPAPAIHNARPSPASFGRSMPLHQPVASEAYPKLPASAILYPHAAGQFLA